MSFFKSIQKALSNVNPKTYSGLGIVLTWAGAILMIPATLAAKKRLDEKQPETLGGKIATVAPCYIGPVGMLTGGTALEVAGVTKAVTAATNLGAIAVSSTTAANAYCEAVDKYAPKEAKEKINETVASKLAAGNAPTQQQLMDQRQKLPNGMEIYTFETPKDLCVEPITGRYFLLPINELSAIETQITNILKNEEEFRFDYLFDLYGIPASDVGPDFGWAAEDFYDIDGEIKFKFFTYSQQAPNGRPVLVLDYNVKPHQLTK